MSSDIAKKLMNNYVFQNRFREYFYDNFEDIIDYLALIVYIQKLLHVSKTEQKAFIKEFEVLTNDYINYVGTSISSITINNNWKHRLKVILNYI